MKQLFIINKIYIQYGGKRMKILVTGATGKLGNLVVEALLKTVNADQLAVSVRNPEKAESLKARGVEIRQGDFDQPETLNAAFAGIEKLLIISADGDNETRIRQHLAAVAAAKNAQVKLVAYTSVGNAPESTLSLAEVHRTTEEAIRNTGLPYVFLRNNWYLENESSGIQGVLVGAPWVTSAENGKVGWALRRDYAEAAAAVLAQAGHENKVYELSGKPLTQHEFALALGKVIGKDVPVQTMDDATYEEVLKSIGLPEFLLPLLIGIQKAIREGALDIVSDDFEKLLGRPATPIADALPEIIKSFS